MSLCVCVCTCVHLCVLESKGEWMIAQKCFHTDTGSNEKKDCVCVCLCVFKLILWWSFKLPFRKNTSGQMRAVYWSVHASCLDSDSWSWSVDFHTSKECVRKSICSWPDFRIHFFIFHPAIPGQFLFSLKINTINHNPPCTHTHSNNTVLGSSLYAESLFCHFSKPSTTNLYFVATRRSLIIYSERDICC